MADWEILIPISFFAMIVAIVGLTMHFRTQRARHLTGGDDYRRLAEEAVRGQQVLLDEMKAMNASLREIEKLLREV